MPGAVSSHFLAIAHLAISIHLLESAFLRLNSLHITQAALSNLSPLVLLAQSFCFCYPFMSNSWQGVLLREQCLVAETAPSTSLQKRFSQPAHTARARFNGVRFNPRPRTKSASCYTLRQVGFLSSPSALAHQPKLKTCKPCSQVASPRLSKLDRSQIANSREHMVEVCQTDLSANWARKLRDEQARARIQIRTRRLSLRNFEDVKPVG